MLAWHWDGFVRVASSNSKVTLQLHEVASRVVIIIWMRFRMDIAVREGPEIIPPSREALAQSGAQEV